ncbi:alpha/beta fold hydrolase [Tateyamaria sp.]|uniref:alpha/beta fold hydrolase n=1 Tax=Tateyamaria sp. TaxID=1929288 RepID=UPI003B20D79E
MTWVLLLVAALIAMPFTIEWMRDGLSERYMKTAPGEFALLSQGQTHYEWLGPNRGPVALCIHGLTTPSFVWRGMAKGLALMGFRVLIYDHYGRGYSERIKGKQDAAFFLQQIDDLLLHEKVQEPLTVIGYSMGGAVATRFAAARPGLVKQLVLIAPAGMQHVMGKAATFARDTPILGDWLFLMTYPRLLRKGIAAEVGLPGSVEGITALQQTETDKRGYFPAVLSSLRGVLRDTTEEAHRAVAAAGIPVLAIWGAEDDVIPLAAREVLAEWNPSARHAVIADAGHGVTYTHTDQVLEALRTSRS